MDATYEKTLDTINKKPRAQRELARRILIWTMYAQEPLFINDLAYVISFERDTRRLKDVLSSIPTEQNILNACANLISVDQGRYPCVRFVHFSVEEYLTSHQSQSEQMEKLKIGYEAAHREILQTCMVFLTRFPKQKDFLGWYASCEWPHHLLEGHLNSLPVYDKIVTLALIFFGKRPLIPIHRQYRRQETIYLRFSLPVLALMFDLPSKPPLREKELEGENLEAAHPLDLDCIVLSDDKLAYHAAIALNSIPVAWRLYSHGFTLNYSYCDPGGRSSKGLDLLRLSPLYSVSTAPMAEFLLDNGTTMEPQLLHNTSIDPLEYFVKKGDWGVEILQVLLDRVVDQGGERLQRALKAAIEGNFFEGVRLLLDKGVDTITLGKRHGNILQVAVRRGEVEIIRQLLEKGVDVNIQGGEYGNALQAAAYMSEVEVIQLLLDKGANVNAQGGKYGSALQAAVLKGKVKVIQLLLDKGADINVQGGEYGNALQAAAYMGEVEVIQLLLDKGADVSAQGGKYGNALQAAVLKGKVKAIQLVLDKGADVNIQGGEYGNALQAATCLGDIEVIQLLLEKGADVNALGGECGNALQAAVLEGKPEIIHLLLDKGADVHAQGGRYENVLHAAASRGNLEVILLLLNKGADVNAQGGCALEAAAYHGRVEAIHLLLDKGADVNAQSKEYGNALQAATTAERAEVVRLLLDKGADVNALGGRYGSTLQNAAYMGTEEVIRLLLDKGASFDAQDRAHSDALQAAAFLGRVEVVQLLLDKGADVHAQSGEFGSALQAATLAYTDQAEIIQLLLDRGADVNAQGGRYGSALQAAAYTREVEVIRLLLDKGADVNARGGVYGTALQAALAPSDDEFEPRYRKMPADIFSVVELLLDRGADITAHTPDSEHGSAFNAGKKLWERDGHRLGVLKKLLASRGWDGDATESSGDAPGASQDTVEGEPGNYYLEGLGTSNKKNGFGASVHVWGLFAFTSLVFLLYAAIAIELWV